MTRPIHVLQLTSTSSMGGAEQMVLTLARLADPARLRVSILSLMGDGALTARAAAAGIPAENWGLTRLADPRLFPRLRRHLAGGGYDLVHTYGLRADVLTRWVANGLRLPLISSISSPDPWRGGAHVWLDRLTADGVTAWLAVCEAARRTRIGREGFPEARIHVVHNGIPDAPPPDQAGREAARRAMGLAPDAPVLLVMGNLRAAKGYPDLIDALARLAPRWPRLVCLCAGRDDSAGTIPALARARGLDRAGGLQGAPGMLGAMRFLGFVRDVAPLLAAADLVVSSSHWEGMPINLLEAMRAARPIVATAVGGVPEMITSGREGVLVPPRAPEALARAIGDLLGEPGRDAEARARREAMSAAARARFLAQFTAERMVEEHTRWYEVYGAGPPRDSTP